MKVKVKRSEVGVKKHRLSFKFEEERIDLIGGSPTYDGFIGVPSLNSKER